MKKTLLVSCFLISMMLMATAIGYAGNPLPPLPEGSTYQYVGPDVPGTLTFVEIPEGLGVTVTFRGACKNILLNNTAFFSINFFECISPEFLLGTCTQPADCTIYCWGLPEKLPDTLIPYECYPENRSVVSPVVYKVVEFTHNGNVKIAKIVARFAIIK